MRNEELEALFDAPPVPTLPRAQPASARNALATPEPFARSGPVDDPSEAPTLQPRRRGDTVAPAEPLSMAEAVGEFRKVPRTPVTVEMHDRDDAWLHVAMGLGVACSLLALALLLAGSVGG